MWLSEEEGTRILGKEKALRFKETFGGQRVYIPLKPKAKHKIAECVGISGMAALCRECGKEWVEVPNQARKKIKKFDVIDSLAKGISQRKTAQETGVSLRYVTMVAKDCKELIALKSLELEHSRSHHTDTPCHKVTCGTQYGESA